MKRYILPFLIFIAVLLRLYRIEATMTFLEDEGRDMLMVKRMVDAKRPVFLGPQTSTGDMYLGPFYYYFITPALLIADWNPVGPAVLIALTGVITVWLLYIFIKSWYGEFPAAITAFLYASLPLVVATTRNSWNPNLVPLVSLLFIFTLDKITSVKKSSSKIPRKWFFSLGILAGILTQLHYMTLVFLLTSAIYLLVHFRRRPKKLFQLIIYSLFGFVVINIPFLIFEWRNDFVNLQAIARFVTSRDTPNIRYSLPAWLWWDKFSSTSIKLIGGILGISAFRLDSLAIPITAAFFVLSALGILAGGAKSSRFPSHLYHLIAPLAVLGIYQEYIHLHYLGFLYPVVFFLIGALLASPNKKLKITVSAFVLVVALYALPTTSSYLRSGPTNQTKRAREVASYIARDSAGSSYNVVSSPKTHTTPYQYFLAISDFPPSLELSETLYLICQDQPCTPEDINSSLLYITGPAHPYLANYIGHPLFNYFDRPRTLIFNDHVSNGIWVAKLALSADQ